MNFSFLYAAVVGALLLIEPFVLRSSFRERGTLFWFILGVVGLAGVLVDYCRRKK